MSAISKLLTFLFDRQEAKAQCAFNEELDSGYLRSTPQWIVNYLESRKEMESHIEKG